MKVTLFGIALSLILSFLNLTTPVNFHSYQEVANSQEQIAQEILDDASNQETSNSEQESTGEEIGLYSTIGLLTIGGASSIIVAHNNKKKKDEPSAELVRVSKSKKEE